MGNSRSSPKTIALPFTMPLAADRTITNGDKKKKVSGNMSAEKARMPLRALCLMLGISSPLRNDFLRFNCPVPHCGIDIHAAECGQLTVEAVNLFLL